MALGDSIVTARIFDANKLVGPHDMCRADGHFGCVHWTDEDLQSKFSELNIPMSAEALGAVKASRSMKRIDDRMVELGWDVIEEAIMALRK